MSDEGREQEGERDEHSERGPLLTEGQLSYVSAEPPLVRCPQSVALLLAESIERGEEGAVHSADLSYNALADGCSLRRLLPVSRQLTSLVLDNNELTSEAMAAAAGLQPGDDEKLLVGGDEGASVAAQGWRRGGSSILGRMRSGGKSSGNGSPSADEIAAVVACGDAPDQLDRLPPLVLPKLQTLTLNNNSIEDIHLFVAAVAVMCPALSYLSLLKNKACRDPLMGGDADDYRRHRLFVLFHLRSLRFLDSTPVSAAERGEANRVGRFQSVKRIHTSQKTLEAIGADGSGSDSPAAASLASFTARPEEDDSAPLPETESRGSRARFGVSRYVYYGKHSEGNRFITNDEL